jgi:type IV pilus assembly protein PilC
MAESERYEQPARAVSLPDAEPARRPQARLKSWLRALSAVGMRVRPAHIVILIRHLATLLGAGLSISKSLKTVARQLDHPGLASIVSQLGDEVEAGEMLSSAMALHPRIFDTFTINVVRAGEAGGTLAETLDDLALDLEKRETLRRTILGAMVYPAIVIVLASLVVTFLLVFVVPVFEDVFAKMGVPLPLVTRLLLAASRLVVAFWWVPALVLPALIVSWRPLMRIEQVRRQWDRLALRLPLLGKLRRKVTAARFLGAFSTLLGSGVSIVESLRLMSELADNVVVREAVDDIRHHVSRGGKMADPMERHADIFSPMAIQMVSVGEETGSLPEAAARTATFLAQDVDARVKTLTTLIEPLLTVGLGFVVGTIALAIYLPMFDLMKHVSH